MVDNLVYGHLAHSRKIKIVDPYKLQIYVQNQR